MTEWHDDEEFWRETEDFLFTPERMASAATDVDGVVALLGLRPGARVLDMCTGVGRHAVELAKRGFRVTGVDRTRMLLDRARRAAEAAGVDVELVEEDMRRFVRPGAFDGAISLFTSFGYFADDAENRRVVGNIFESLAPTGAAAFEMAGKEAIARIYQQRGWDEIGDALLLQERHPSDDWGRMSNRWIVIRDGRKREFRVEHRLYSGVELRDLLRSVGFEKVDLFGSLEGPPYDENAKRLVAVARRA